MRYNILKQNGKVRKKFIHLSSNFYKDPYLDDYVNMECPSCQKIIHYGYNKCPICGVAIDPNHPEVREAKKRSIQDFCVAISGLLMVLAVVILILFSR